jgi:rRNA maturation endonuclease Nob1
MSGNTQKVLLDSNAYFRLGNSIRPLLAQTFGSAPQYSLHVLAELDDEYATSVRLRHKFEWVKETEYCADRKARRFELNGKKHQEAGNAFTFLLAYADEQGINLSREDLKALAVGYVMGIPVVTDDGGMIEVATANGIECWSTIKLLRIMQTAGRIDLETVTQIIEYWDYDKDLPMSLPKLRKLYTDYFGSSCPI